MVSNDVETQLSLADGLYAPQSGGYDAFAWIHLRAEWLNRDSEA